VQVLEDRIRDLERILRATEKVYEMEKSPERRTRLSIEMGDLEYQIDRLRESIERLKSNLD
jgi:hypothetical protein